MLTTLAAVLVFVQAGSLPTMILAAIAVGLTLKRLLLSPPKMAVAEIMTVGLKAVGVADTPEKVMEVISKYNLLAVPVLEDGHMVGIVPADAVIELFLPDSITKKPRFAAH